MADQPSLASPLARIDRADELLTHLDSALNTFVQTRPYVVEELPDPIRRPAADDQETPPIACAARAWAR